LAFVKPKKLSALFFMQLTYTKQTISEITICESGIVFGEVRANLNSAISLSGAALTAYLP
jgi:hypothetical protein